MANRFSPQINTCELMTYIAPLVAACPAFRVGIMLSLVRVAVFEGEGACRWAVCS